MYRGTKDKKFVTDGCACYDEKGKCWCSECYYCYPYVNCTHVDRYTEDTSLIPLKWNNNHWEEA